MKKLIIFLIGTLVAFIPYTVKAQETQFYEAERIADIWIDRITSDNVKYYQTARMYREVGTRRIAYCIEPFVWFKDGSKYDSTITPENLSEAQKERISLIAHFGYNYKYHDHTKYYAIAQVMIWQTVDPNAQFYFTDSLNGNRIEKYKGEIEHMEKLIENYQKEPSFANNEYNIVSGQDLSITDENSILSNYKTNDKYTTIDNNTLKVNNLPVGEHTIILTRNDDFHNDPVIFYESEDSQNFVTIGNTHQKEIKIKIKVTETKVKINKLDKETNSKENSTEAELEGAKYQLYDKNMKKLAIIEIDKNHEAYIKNLIYGKYYLQEIEAGKGYELDKNIYEFEITKEKPNIELNLYNQVIKGKVTINKSYLTDEELKPEENITFNIYNENQELVESITTNNLGTVEIFLPYGKYLVKQITTTPGYDIVEPFYIIINNNEELTFNLTNYKIKVPNTKTNDPSLLLQILTFIFQILSYV